MESSALVISGSIVISLAKLLQRGEKPELASIFALVRAVEEYAG